jgi:hypothetical protein
MNRIICLALSACLVSCVSGPVAFPAESVPSTSRQEIILLGRVLAYKVPQSVAVDEVGGGLLPGTYVAEREDALGIFYRGEGRPQFHGGVKGLAEKRFALLTGGIWVSKNPSIPPRLYFYVEAGYPSVDTVENAVTANVAAKAAVADAAAPLTSSQIANRPNVSIGQGAVAGAVAGALSAAPLAANVGKINFWPGINDPQFLLAVSRLQAQPVARSPVVKP